MENVWVNICQKLEQMMAKADYQVWITPIRAEFSDGKLTLYTLNEFVADFVRKTYLSDILKVASAVLGYEPALNMLVTARELPPDAAESNGSMRVSSNASAAARTVFTGTEGFVPASDSHEAQNALPLRWSESQKLIKHWRHCFEDFVVGPCNELAHAAARDLCDRQLYLSKVLYLCSEPGLGKTHLMHSVGGYLSKAGNFSAPRIEYLSAEEFSTNFRQALNSDGMARFKNRFREADVLLLEDIHFFQGKEKTQDELLATISVLLERGSKVVFTSSFAPRELQKMDSQLLSRMGSGLIASIDRPDAETRRRIITCKASLHHMPLADDIADYLAENMNSDIRQIESCIHTLALKAKLCGRALTMDMVRETVSAYVDNSSFVDMPEIIRMVCEGFGISPDALGSKSRRQDYVQARNAAFYLARKYTELSLQDIGRRFNRTHSTVIKGITSLEHEISRQSHSGRQLAKTITLIEHNGNFPQKSR